MTALPEDLAEALRERPGVVRQHALEQALTYALRAGAAVDSAEASPRAHVMALAAVSGAWSALAEALKGAL